MVVAEQVQDAVHDRAAPGVADDIRADHEVAELPRQPFGQLLARVERKREHVGRFVDAEMVALEGAALLGTDEVEAELAVVDALGREGGSNDGDGLAGRHLPAASVLDVDGDGHVPYLRRPVPVSSECCLYASTMRCTSLCRTTSWCEKRTNEMPSTEPRMSCTWIRPDACSRGRSICVTSPVTTTLEPNPSRVRNICICSGLVFWASSRMMKESLRVLPRMKARGATSMVPRSMKAARRSASSMS